MGLWWQNDSALTGFVEVGRPLIQTSPRGSIDWIGALKQARMMVASGIESAVVTTTIDQARHSRRLLGRLQRLILQHALDLEVQLVVAMEMKTDLFKQVAETSMVSGSLNRNYVFLNIRPGNFLPVAPVVESLGRMGLQTVLMSAENSLSLRDRSDEMRRLAKADAIIQFSSESLLTDRSDPGKAKFCRKVIRSGGCQLIRPPVSPNHDAGNAAESVRLVQRWIGKTRAQQIFAENPRRLFFDRFAEASDVQAN